MGVELVRVVHGITGANWLLVLDEEWQGTWRKIPSHGWRCGVTRGGWGGGDGRAQWCVSSQNCMGYESIRVMWGNESIKLNLWIVVPRMLQLSCMRCCFTVLNSRCAMIIGSFGTGATESV